MNDIILHTIPAKKWRKNRKTLPQGHLPESVIKKLIGKEYEIVVKVDNKLKECDL